MAARSLVTLVFVFVLCSALAHGKNLGVRQFTSVLQNDKTKNGTRVYLVIIFVNYFR